MFSYSLKIKLQNNNKSEDFISVKNIPVTLFILLLNCPLKFVKVYSIKI